MTAALKLYNTLTRTKEVFRPLDPEAVRMYVCGPTVYDFAHIGNARAAIVFDLLFRLLRQTYGEAAVVYTRNVTDVDDKINARAQRDFPDLPLNAAIARVTEGTLRQYREDVAAVGCLPPTHEPRATAHLDEMRAMIERLVARGLAYVAEDHVLFSPSAMDALNNAPRYGALARRSLDEMLAGARVEVAPYKRDPMDFVLWKPSKASEPGWPSPCGIAAEGRPGWHIECSAMSMATLLQPYGGGLACDDPDKNVFDIHGGGIDLVFPHHENEIAQSCCAFGSARMANVWMHNGFLQVEGEKMSKSLGNFFTIHELLHTENFGDSTWSGDVLRLAMLRTHYRQPIDWTAKELQRAHEELSRWYGLSKNQILVNEPGETEVDSTVVEALCEDLNTHEALERIQNIAKAGAGAALQSSLRFLGFSCDPAKLARRINMHVSEGSYLMTGGSATLSIYSNADGTYSTDDATEARINELIVRRKAARQARNFAEADHIRDELAAIGVVIKDNKDGTTAWELRR